MKISRNGKGEQNPFNLFTVGRGGGVNRLGRLSFGYIGQGLFHNLSSINLSSAGCPSSGNIYFINSV